MFAQLMKPPKSATKPVPVRQRTIKQQTPYYAFHLPDSQHTAVTGLRGGLCIQDLSRHLPMRAEHTPESDGLVIQAKLYIDGRDPISPFSKKLNDFFNIVIVPWLNENGYKSYGIMKQLRDFVSEDRYFDDDGTFLEQFAEYLQSQTRTVRGGGSVPVLRPFSIGGLSRPAWPKELKEQLQAKARIQEGGNIRHVVRNNTLKKSLQIFHQQNGDAAMFQLAEQLGVIGENTMAFDACARMLYKKLYLNIDNLWIGDGLVNQMIGFLATPLSEYGLDIVGDRSVFEADTLYTILVNSTQAVRGRHETKGQLIDEIMRVILDYADGLMKVYSNEADFNHQMGLFLDDIGLNLGFDLIDDLSDNIPERQERLLEAETRLQQYILTEGQQGDLPDIFSVFLNLNREQAGESDGEEALETETEEEEIQEAPPEVYRAIEYDTREFELIRQNNCLIYAIANALGIQVEDYQITNIRILLNDLGYANLGDMLDAADDNVRYIILLLLNVDYSNYTFRILNRVRNQFDTFPPSGGGRGQFIDLIYTGDHFYAA